MPITEEEFRGLLADRTGQLTGAPDRLAAVHRRIERHRRRVRAAVASATLAAVGVAVAVPALLTGGSGRDTGIANPTPTVSPAPYAGGGKLIAGGVLHSPQQGSLTLTFTPTDWRLYLQTSCPQSQPDHGWLIVAVNGHAVEGGGCGGGSSASASRDQHYWSALGVRLNQPSTVTLVLSKDPGRGAGPSLCPACPPPTPLPAAQRPIADVALGIYQRVPPADYPLPSPPATLPPLSGPQPGETGLDSRQVGDNGTWTLRVPVGAHIETHFVSPGQVRLLIDGHLVSQGEWWDYTPDASVVDLIPAILRDAGVTALTGQTLTLTVQASRFTVPGWAVIARQDG